MNKYDPDNYQGTNSEGHYSLVSDLTREELQQNLCMAMEALERVEDSVITISDVIDAWRSDSLEPRTEQ